MTRKLFLPLFIFSVIMSSCEKRTRGCMDSNATNFDASVNEDCNCCEYEAKAFFWYDKKTADALRANGSTALTYLQNKINIGSTSTNTFWTVQPDCGQTDVISITKDLGRSKFDAEEYMIVDQSSRIIASGTISFTANECIPHQIIWP